MTENVLAKFQVVRILSNNTNRKTAVLLGTFADDDIKEDEQSRAIVVLEKKAFVAEDFSQDGAQYIAQIVRTEEQFVNDIYGNYEIVPGEQLNSKFTGQSSIPAFPTRGCNSYIFFQRSKRQSSGRAPRITSASIRRRKCIWCRRRQSSTRRSPWWAWSRSCDSVWR